MNKFSLYTLLILLFLGLSKNFSPSEKKTPLIQNEKVIAHYFIGAPISVILTEKFQIGFLIKTYFMRLRVAHGFKSHEEVIVRTSKEFWEKNKNNVGMSIFRREENNQKESVIPLPPGSLYVGNLAFGRWAYVDSGKKIWRFHKPYRPYEKTFGWLDFKPSYKFYQRLKIHMKNEQPFYGMNNEFGTEGSVTKQAFKEKIGSKDLEKLSFWEFSKKFIEVPKWSRTTEEEAKDE